MVNYTLPLYQHKTPKWDAQKCAKMAKKIARDGLGTPYPFRGFLHAPTPLGWTVRYNDGCIRDGKWWQGETFHLPKVAKGFEIVNVPTWGFRIKTVTPEPKTK